MDRLRGDGPRLFAMNIPLITCATVTLFIGVIFGNSRILNQAGSPRLTVEEPSPTPCPSPKILSNIVDDCNPAPLVTPLGEQEIAQRQKEWEKTKARLFDVKFPLINKTSIDVDGDRKKDSVTYTIRRWRDDFEGQLSIKSASGRVVWNHEFFMSSRDLAKFLVEVLDYQNAKDWVNSVFDTKAPYHFEAEKKKLISKDLDEEQIKYAAQLHKISAKKMRSEILLQKTNQLFSYRAEWREDFLQLVYIPSLKSFICFSRGY